MWKLKRANLEKQRVDKWLQGMGGVGDMVEG